MKPRGTSRRDVLIGTNRDAIVAGLSGSRPLDAALDDYGRRRDEDARPTYPLTHDLAQLAPPPPPVVELLGALQGNPADTSRHLGVMAGTVPVADFFAPAKSRSHYRQRPRGVTATTFITRNEWSLS